MKIIKYLICLIMCILLVQSRDAQIKFEPYQIAENTKCPYKNSFENVKDSTSCMELVKSKCPENQLIFGYEISTKKCFCIGKTSWYNKKCSTASADQGYGIFSTADRIDFNSADIENDAKFEEPFEEIPAQEERDYQILYRYLGMPKEKAQEIDANSESVMPNVVKHLYQVFVPEKIKELVQETNGYVLPKHYALKLGDSIWEIRGDGTKIGENNIIMYWPNYEDHPFKNEFCESDWKGKTILSNHRITQFVQKWLKDFPVYGILGQYDVRDFKNFKEKKIANCQDFTMDLTYYCKNNASSAAQKELNVYQPETQIWAIIKKLTEKVLEKIIKKASDVPAKAAAKLFTKLLNKVFRLGH